MFLSHSRSAIVLLSLLSLLSAFLLFQVQPMISKFILPWFGGGPGVWSACLLFFQSALFLGYAYAHGLMRLPRKWQWLVHSALVIAAVAMLPVTPDAGWKPPPGSQGEPAVRIVLLLLATVGLPYFVLSSTSPLAQVWLARSGTGLAPWRLYAISNLGSLAALLSYPFVIEPRWDVVRQTWLWSAAFGVFVLAVLACAFGDWKNAGREKADGQAAADGEQAAPRWWQRSLWVLLPAAASMLLLAATNHLCQDVAVVPFLWVAPLSLYLLTFIICFEHERWYRPLLWALPAAALVFATGIYEKLPWDWAGSFKAELAVSLAAVFLACMVCHGELARLKPGHAHLTEFYLLLSAGGALGGFLVTLAAPRFFTSYLEWPLSLMVALGIAAAAAVRSVWSIQRRWIRFPAGVAVIGAAVAGLLQMREAGFTLEDRILRVRSFFGALSVEENTVDDGTTATYRRLHHGGIVHGLQILGDGWRTSAFSYYGPDTGIGRALEFVKKNPAAKVGVVGLGTGSAAVWGQAGHTYRFYEINPQMAEIAREQFTYLGDLAARGGTVEVLLGDARLALEREPPQSYDVMLLDAFSGDSIPVHLITLEAFQIYQRHLKSDGILVVHVSNRYLELAPVVEKIAAALGIPATRIVTELNGWDEFTDYVLVTRNEAFLKVTPPDTRGYEVKIPVSLWTDQRNNLFEILEP